MNVHAFNLLLQCSAVRRTHADAAQYAWLRLLLNAWVMNCFLIVEKIHYQWIKWVKIRVKLRAIMN